MENQEQSSESQTIAKIDESHIRISHKCELCKYETQQKLYLKNHMVQIHYYDVLDEQTTNWNTYSKANSFDKVTIGTIHKLRRYETRGQWIIKNLQKSTRQSNKNQRRQNFFNIRKRPTYLRI